MTAGPAVRLEDVWRVYDADEHRVEALRGADLEVEPGRFAAVVGPSGSGKTTLLNLVGAMDRPTRGTVEVADRSPAELDEAGRTRFRRKQVGFVFQEFNLVETLSALENVTLPMEYAGMPKDRREPRARDLLEEVGLANREAHLPGRLSGGEKQRVGIARAFANDPAVILADEPTGNLDRETGGRIVELLDAFRRREGKTVLVGTHDEALAGEAEAVWRLEHGVLEPVT